MGPAKRERGSADFLGFDKQRFRERGEEIAVRRRVFDRDGVLAGLRGPAEPELRIGGAELVLRAREKGREGQECVKKGPRRGNGCVGVGVGVGVGVCRTALLLPSSCLGCPLLSSLVASCRLLARALLSV